MFAANEALALGYGGVTAMATATGIARSTINRGIAELKTACNAIGQRVRRPGAGRKRAIELQPGLPAALESLIEDAICGDPETPLRWVSRSQRHIVEVLRRQGFAVSQKLVGGLLRQLNYSCQANRKTREGTNHPDRDAQFAHINAEVKATIAAGEPAISVDTKKKELVGDFKNGGRELRRAGDPERVRVHDFEIKGLGKVAPYGVYDIAANEGWVNVGIDADTAAFAPGASPHHHRRLRWQQRRPCPPLETRVATLRQRDQPCRDRRPSAAGTSKWNRIEHRLFAYISQNWRGKPLVSHQVIIQLITATTTDTGLTVTCDIDANRYPKGIEVSNAEMAALNIQHDAFHGEWNYTISPNQQAPP